MAKSILARNWLRPRFTLAALLGLITLFAFPLAYISQRRAWNLKRKAAYELLRPKLFDSSVSWPATNRRSRGTGDPFADDSPSWTFIGGWNDLCLENAAPRIEEFIATSSHRTSGVDNDAELAPLAAFPEVKLIFLVASPDLSDRGLAILDQFPSLKDLGLMNVKSLTGDFLKHLKPSNQLETLYLSRMDQLDGSRLVRLSCCSHLKNLEISDCRYVTEASLRNVDLPPSLKKLAITSHSIGDETLARWLSQTKLTSLKLHCPITRKLASALAQQTQLEELEIIDAPFLDEDFEFLIHCKNLKSLKLNIMPIRGDFLSRLPAPHLLEDISLGNTLLADKNLAAIPRFQHLKTLDLAWTPITGEGFAGTAKWPATTAFSLLGTQLSEPGKAAFAKLGGPMRIYPPPANWEPDDFLRYSVGKPPAPDSPFSTTMQIVGGPYPWDSPLWRGSPKNCPKEPLAPVLRLYAMMREKLKKQGYDLE